MSVQRVQAVKVFFSREVTIERWGCCSLFGDGAFGPPIHGKSKNHVRDTCIHTYMYVCTRARICTTKHVVSNNHETTMFSPATFGNYQLLDGCPLVIYPGWLEHIFLQWESNSASSLSCVILQHSTFDPQKQSSNPASVNIDSVNLDPSSRIWHLGVQRGISVWVKTWRYNPYSYGDIYIYIYGFNIYIYVCLVYNK